MRAISLQSGSNGNCIYVEAGGVRLLFDAGISGRQAELRLAGHGIDIRRVDATVISHAHRDHISCAGIYHRKFGLPIYVTAETLRLTNIACKLGRISDVRHFEAGAAIPFGDVTVETICTEHDCPDGVGFVVDDGVHRLGVLTDLGHVFPRLKRVMGSLDAVVIESNYDAQMLEHGPYPLFLKQRIRGEGGHISNIEAAKLLASSACKQMKWACLAHLSESNNTPDVAVHTHRAILGKKFPLHVATRCRETGILEV
jgi:phosphoribosyl 1,2-cyclic phosphodiesterase